MVVTPYGVSPTTTSCYLGQQPEPVHQAVSGTSQSHDANGNLTNNGTLTFKYSYKNLITEVRQSSGGTLVAEYLYDANGRRVVKNVNGGIFERYIYADVETISVLNGSQAWKQDFVFDLTGIDRILMLEQADVLDQDSDSNTTEITRSYYHRNALGSVMEISTASQTEAASYRYTPYGEVTITRGGTVQSSDPLGQAWGYTSRFRDGESSMLYFRARHSSPATGRFMQRDPLGYSASQSLYEYCRSRPTMLTDPLGLDPEDPCAELRAQLERAKAARDDAERDVDAAADEHKALDEETDNQTRAISALQAQHARYIAGEKSPADKSFGPATVGGVIEQINAALAAQSALMNAYDEAGRKLRVAKGHLEDRELDVRRLEAAYEKCMRDVLVAPLLAAVGGDAESGASVPRPCGQGLLGRLRHGGLR